LPEEGPTRSWSSPGDHSDQLRDFALFDTIVKEFTTKYCINRDEIFVVGHSLGAWFTNSLACARGDVIRAIGSVGGGTTINTCAGPTAAVIMHNPLDNLASFKS
jgi:polyhydroxybutyrate depolymerase